ncbi:CHASE3 domain-containing protein [Actinoplanes bogorensis]|uniref:Sensor-like histidine kinase SenX3 n=1 Tax=Paractinoplanes bogorensis TaxID=1610840 RepID=A0ABS5Z4N8_9ACTN|nr:ATP-binding protein [Actinoplanes bogorensis]MBU2669390.1 CHASE3 domain-containing protein [Actinoplanes bogorensis]
MIFQRFALTRLKYRVAGGFAVLLLLFLALIVANFVVTERARTQHEERGARIDVARDTNRAVLQYMTDAETGIRGFQLTGDTAFLQPYTSGRAGAFSALDRLVADPLDAETARLLEVERQAAEGWLYDYAIPIVNAGVPDDDAARAARGKDLFDQLRTANADVFAAVESFERLAGEHERAGAEFVTLLFAGLACLVVAAGLGLALLHQRHLLVPLEHIRLTLRRLADGDLTARTTPAGPGELRAVAGTLNDLAAETERLLSAEKARVARIELRQAVTLQLQEDAEPEQSAWRIADMIGTTLGADVLHSRITIQAGVPIAITWPAGAPPLDPAIDEQARSCAPGSALRPGQLAGGLVIPLSGDAGCPPGLICLIRAGRPWSEEESRLLIGLAREVDHAAHQERLRLRQARLINELRVLDEQKDVFVATVTHELRTPLTSILGYSEMLSEDLTDNPEHARGLSRVQKRGIDAILRNAHRLEATVDDLLLLDRTNDRSGAETLPVDLARLIGQVHATLGVAARAKDLRCELSTEPAWVRGDAAQLERAVRHLLDNAVKFTAPGGHLECRLTRVDDRAVVTVSDTGIGIPADDVPGLFTPFHRAANAMDQAVQGNGLGLAIVRNIVNDHGGTVTARSELGQGSTFTMVLPVMAEPQAHRPAAEPSRSGRG